MPNLVQIVLLFLVCGLLGWVVETIYWAFTERKFFFPGYFKQKGLPIPFLPIYGFGALLLTLLHTLLGDLPLFARVAFGALVLTIFEYASSVFCIKVLKVKLWDYSNLPLNHGGHISALHSFYWLIAVLTFEILYPLLRALHTSGLS